MTLHADRAGDGTGCPVLLLHGFTGSGRAWPPVLVETLAQGRPVLVVDLPGHGRSPMWRRPERYRIHRVVDVLIQLLDRHGWERADWIGYSMGGRLAIAALALRPQRVRRVVLESTTAGIETDSARAERRAADEALAARIERDGISSFVEEWTAHPLFASQRGLPGDVRRRVRERRLQNDGPALAAVLRGLGTGAQPAYWDVLPERPHHALVLTGALDHKFRRLGARLADALPCASHHTVPGVGHTVHLEAPEPWLDAVVPFLDAGDPHVLE